MDFDEFCWWVDEKFNGKKPKKNLSKKIKKFAKKYDKALYRGREKILKICQD